MAESVTSSNDVTFGFQGSYVRSVDRKGRFSLPFRFRRGSGISEERFVVTDGPDQTLCLIPHSEWIRSFQRIRRRNWNQERREGLRQLSSASEVLEPDAQGRIMVNPATLGRYGVSGKVLVLGMGHYLELWDPQRYEQYLAGLPEHDTSFLDEFFG